MFKQRRPSAARGWVAYPQRRDRLGRFYEDLKRISGLVGSSMYESQRVNGQWYIRRTF